MKQTSVEQLMAIKGYLKQTSRYDGKSAEQIRQEMAEAAARIPETPNAVVEKTVIGSMSGEWVMSRNNRPVTDKTILYFHGGGFISGTRRL